MSRQNDQRNLGSLKLDFFRLVGASAGGTIAYIITSHLPSLSSALACAMAIALSSLASRGSPILCFGGQV